MIPTWTVSRLRDLTLISNGTQETLVIACDSTGGIGPKAEDTVKISARAVTHFTVRVPLLEVIASGARPLLIVNTLNVEKQPSAEPMIEEVRAIARSIGLDPDVAVTGSTEDNVITVATGIGVTIVGALSGPLRVGTARAGDDVYCVGLPLSAPSDLFEPDDWRMPSLGETQQLVERPEVHEVLPVGSRGVNAELRDLAESANVDLEIWPSTVATAKTGGPSSCLLVAIAPDDADALRRVRLDLPVTLVARLHPRSPQPETT